MDSTDSRLAHSPGTASDDVGSPFNLPSAGDRLAFEPVPLRHRRDGLTPQKQRDFVEALADCGIVREAAARIGISEQAISRARRRVDAESFDRACDAAQMFGVRRLRSIAFERAIEGTLKDHYYHGQLVGQERVFDNRLLIYLLGKTEHLLEPSEESRAICEHWEPYVEALGEGLPTPELILPDPDEENRRLDERPPAVWNEDGTWWTPFPPPEGFDGEEEGRLGEDDYQRTLTEDEEAVVNARNRADDEADLARCCAARDSYFGLPPRGVEGYFQSQESRNNGTSDLSGEEDREVPDHPAESPDLAETRQSPRHPGERRDLGETRRDPRHPGGSRDLDETPPDLPAWAPGFRRDDDME